MRLILIGIFLFYFTFFNTAEGVGSQKTFVWVHHHTTWWKWWWHKNCADPSSRPSQGLLSVLTYNWQNQSFNDAMEELKMVVTQAKAVGFDVIPTLNIHIHRGYAKGKEFPSWFDKKAWADRSKWLEAMIPYSFANKMAVDVEPYWKSKRGNPRYPSNKDFDRLAEAIKPFIDLVKKHKIILYVIPGGLNYTWNRVAAHLGANLVMLDEGSYMLPDFYGSDQEKFKKLLRGIKKKQKLIEKTGMKYIPGFYETALKKPGFFNEIAKQGYDEAWVYIRRKSEIHRYHKFCLPEFYDLKPYNFPHMNNK
ncbi:MAG: hypothetical protein ACE5EK_05400 [Nitrospinales bacterium]